jgi:hypothetical protein
LEAKYFIKFDRKNLNYKNHFLILHPLLARRLIEGKKEIGFRLGRLGKGEGGKAGKKYLDFFLEGK